MIIHFHSAVLNIHRQADDLDRKGLSPSEYSAAERLWRISRDVCVSLDRLYAEKDRKEFLKQKRKAKKEAGR